MVEGPGDMGSAVLMPGHPDLDTHFTGFPLSRSGSHTPRSDLELSTTVSPNRSRRFFDQRLTSGFHRTSIGIEKMSVLTAAKQKDAKSPNLNWGYLRKISDVIFSTENKQQNGSPLVMAVTDLAIAFGTDKNAVYVFSLQQELLHLVKTSNVKLSTLITTLAFSFDSTYLVVGYSDGTINLWDLHKNSPIITVKPVTLHELQHNGSHFTAGHTENAAIQHLEFIGARHTSFLSSDHRGMIFYHDGGRSLLGFYCNSKILVGKYDFGKIDYNKAIFDFRSLPLGPSPYETDLLGLVAFVTPKALVVVSTKPSFTTQFKLSVLSILGLNVASAGSLCWFPATKYRESLRLPSLAFAWSNSLTVLDVKASKQRNEYDEEIISVDFTNKRSWTCVEPISVVKQFNNDILLVMSKTQRAYFVSRNSLNVLKEFDLIGKNLKYMNILTENDIGLDTKSYFGSLSCFKSNLFTLDSKDAAVGSLSNWADLLMDNINTERYFDALKIACDMYLGHVDMLLIGLPEDDSVRHGLVRDYVVQLLKVSMKSMFEKNIDYSSLLHLYLETCVVIEADNEMYDLVFEKLSETGCEDIFFSELEDFLLSSQIYVLSPTILKAMVEHYFIAGNPATLEQLICLLDLTQLDIDFTLNICKKYKLSDCIAYIWSQAMGDYLTPIIEALKQIKLFNEAQNLTYQEQFEIQMSTSYVYPYIAYTLTGRQYPTGKPIKQPFNTSSKRNIFYFLFSGSGLSWPPNTPKFRTVDNYELEPAFPYLQSLIKFDSKSMMATLNEAFEDDILNEDELDFNIKGTHKYQLTVNRQYIIDILLSMQNDSDFKLSFIDKLYVSIFISRNYPKFKQFIKLAGSIMHYQVMLLCKAGKLFYSRLPLEERENLFGVPSDDISQLSHDLVQDCELSLLSLLSVYKPHDIVPLLLEIEDAKYYNVMFTIYKSEHMHVNILELWIKLHSEKQDSDNDNPFLENTMAIDYTSMIGSVPTMVHNALKTAAQCQNLDVTHLIEENMEMFVTDDPCGMADVILHDCPSLSKQIVYIRDGKSKFAFLKRLYEMISKGESQNVKLSGDLNLKQAYVNELIQELVNNGIGTTSSQTKAELTRFVLGVGKLDNNIIRMLKSSNNTTVQSVLIDYYVREGEYEKAFSFLAESIKKVSELIKDKEYTKEKENCMAQLFNKLLTMTESFDERLLEPSSALEGLNLREALLLSTVELAIELAKEVENRNPAAETPEKVLCKKMVSVSFSYISNLSWKNSQSFGNILEKYLNRSAVKITKLGDLRMVLTEIVASSVNDEKIIKLIKKLVEVDIFEDLEILQSLKLKGWTPDNTQCEVCGKNVWGAHIGEEYYTTWKNHQLTSAGFEVNDVFSATEAKLEVYVFQCKHVYHKKCLDGMGTTQQDKKCILCESR